MKSMNNEELKEACFAIEDCYNDDVMLDLFVEYCEAINDEIKERKMENTARIERILALCRRFLRLGIAEGLATYNLMLDGEQTQVD